MCQTHFLTGCLDAGVHLDVRPVVWVQILTKKWNSKHASIHRHPERQKEAAGPGKEPVC